MIFSATKVLYASFVADIRGTGPIFNNVTMPMDRVPAINVDPTTSCHVDEKSVPSRDRGDEHKSPIREFGVHHRDNLRSHHVDEVQGGVFPPMTTLTVYFIAAMSKHFS